MKALHVIDCFRLLGGLREPHVLCLQSLGKQIPVLEFSHVSSKDLARARRQRRVDDDGTFFDLARVHQVDEIGEKLLGSFHCEGRHDQRAIWMGCFQHFRAQNAPPGFVCSVFPLDVAVGAFANDIVPASRCGRVILKKLVTWADVA
ncbi:hypothetical protein D9M72_562410 [compost metagenome]